MVIGDVRTNKSSPSKNVQYFKTLRLIEKHIARQNRAVKNSCAPFRVIDIDPTAGEIAGSARIGSTPSGATIAHRKKRITCRLAGRWIKTDPISIEGERSGNSRNKPVKTTEIKPMKRY